MQISLTKKQYEILIELIFVGDWVIFGTETKRNSFSDYEEVIQLMYSFSKQFGMDDKVGFDQRRNVYYEKGEMEKYLHKLIKEYEERVFWDHLISRMVEKDLAMQEKVLEPESEEALYRHLEVEAKYEFEFMVNDLKNLRLID